MCVSFLFLFVCGAGGGVGLSCNANIHMYTADGFMPQFGARSLLGRDKRVR